jgi:hypothetical protein
METHPIIGIFLFLFLFSIILFASWLAVKGVKRHHPNLYHIKPPTKKQSMEDYKPLMYFTDADAKRIHDMMNSYVSTSTMDMKDE